MIGGGLSGLTTAHLLAGRGFEVTVLEARCRAGGRILTLREPFTGGLYAEAGAIFVVGDPALIALANELGVEVKPPDRPPRRPSVTIAAGLRKIVQPDEPETPPAYSAEERALDDRARLEHYFGPALIGDVRTASWLTPELARYDAIDAATYLRERGASSAFAEEIASMISMGEKLDSLSALWVMQEIASFQQEIGWAGGGRIPGGTDRLTEALAKKLGARFQPGAVARRIEETKEGARVHYTRDDGHYTLAADRVVIAVHAPVVKAIEIDPPLPGPVLKAIESVKVANAVRFYAESSRRVWTERGLSGAVATDLPLGMVRDETAYQPGAAGILGAYLSGEVGREVARLSVEARRERLLAHMELAHPGVRSAIVATAEKVWGDDPFVRGAYAWFPPGYLTRMLPEITRPVGRLHFAGDHTSHRPGFMHGAVASAHRVAEEVTSSVAAGPSTRG